MKKILIAVFCMIILCGMSTNVFAKTVRCTDEDFATNAHGCKNKSVDFNGMEITCTDYHQENGLYSCKVTYDDGKPEVVNPNYDPNLVDNKIKGTVGDAWATVAVIVQIVSVGLVVFAGLRYMFSSADQRADIKQGLMYLTIGAVLVFGATTIIQFIVGSAEQIL